MEIPKEDLDKIGKFPVRVFVIEEKDLHKKGGYLYDKALNFAKKHRANCGVSQFVLIRSLCCAWFNFELFCPRCLLIRDVTYALADCEYNHAIFKGRNAAIREKQERRSIHRKS